MRLGKVAHIRKGGAGSVYRLKALLGHLERQAWALLFQ